MRWTNYFPHPGDNRYFVFTFQEESHAAEFESMLNAASIPFERHEENNQYLFGVARTHFREALRCNYLVHARYRTKFIPVTGLRYAMLILTAAAIVLAITGALSSAQAQSRTPIWELELSAVGVLPLEAVGYESIQAEYGGLTLQWQPRVGSGFGLRMRRHIQASPWSITLRMTSDWGLNFASEISGETTADTLSLRAGRYRLPLLARTEVRMNSRWTLNAGLGFTLDFLLSDVFKTGYQQLENTYHEYQVEENRQNRWTAPLRAEIGTTYRPADAKKAAFYLGIMWWREWSTNRWGEAQWERELEKASVRLFMPQAGFALDFRIILPQ
ncbi:MAG: hypothetical protein ACPG08_01375 [Flavobacteriales bacterium]